MLKKVLLFLIIILTGLSSLFAQDENITMNFSGKLKDAMIEIEEQSGYYFLFNQKLIDIDREVSVKCNNLDLKRVLNIIFESSPVKYSIDQQRIILTPEKLLSNDIKLIKGRVSNLNNEPLVGVNILEKGSYNGTISNAEGFYEIELSGKSLYLEFSAIGMKPKQVLVNSSVINIVMEEEATSLDEVVIIGYGEVLKSDLIGAVSQVSGEALNSAPVSSFEQAIAGHVAGTHIRQNSGQPGGGPNIIIRGVNSISAATSPLIIIDGFPYGNYNAQTNNYLNLINPNDIESISIVRDASGKAIYGSRANGGLIIITTKKGKKGKPQISFDSYVGVQTIPSYSKPDVMNATELARFHQERFIDDYIHKNGFEPNADEIPEHVRNPEEYGAGTDWFDAITRNAGMKSYNLNLNGGTEDFNYSISLGHMNQEGVVMETYFKRYTFRSNLEADINDWLHVGFNIAPSWTNNKVGPTDPGAGQFSVYNVLNVAQWADPSAEVYDEFGNLNRTTKGDLIQFYQVNPLLKLLNTENIYQNRQVLAGGNIKIDIFEGAYLKFYGGTNYISALRRNFIPSIIDGEGLEPSFTNAQASNGTSRYENLKMVSENTFNLNRAFADGQHKISLVLGYTVEHTIQTNFSSGANRLIDEHNELINSGNVPTSDPSTPDITQIWFNTGETITENALISYLGRLSYIFKDRYYLTGAFRKDGSSRFGPNNKFAFFPSLSGAWNISKESWFPETNGIVSNLKIEGSYGVIGNNTIGDYTWQGRINNNIAYAFGDSKVNGSALVSIPNFERRWEKTIQKELGIESSFLSDRLILEADYYYSLTEDLLYNLPIPTISGYSVIPTNIGTIENKGLEINLYSRPISKKNFSWTLKANISVNRNKVLKLGEANKPIYSIAAGNSTKAGITQVGSSIGQFYGLQILGLYTQEMIDDPNIPKYSGATVGAPYYFDADSSGTLDSFNDYVVIGNPWPDFTYGLTSNLKYKNLSLSFTISGEQGSQIFDAYREFMLNTDRGTGNYLGVFNVESEIIDRYRVGSEDFSLRSPTTITTGSSQRWRWPNNMGVKNGSYLKLSNITLSYTFDKNLSYIPALSRANVYLSIQNALILSHYHSNPEIGRASGGTLERNVNYSSYPVPRTFTLGISMTL